MVLQLNLKSNPPPQSNHATSPVITPISLLDDFHLLVSNNPNEPVKKRYLLRFVPIAIGSVSVFQIIFHIFSTKHLNEKLRFEPHKQYELYRFITYMLVHDDWIHLTLNIIMQCLFALFLEYRQGSLRVLLLYTLAGCTGVLGAACVHPDLVIGASAGVYALLISNFADLLLNLESINYRSSRLCCIGVTVISDILFNIVHFYSKDEPQISWMAHLVGGVTGLLIGLILFQSYDDSESRRRINCGLQFGALFVYMVLFVVLVVLILQIKKCTPSSVIRVKYVYFC